ncbi:MAG TPA: hypothetical protein VH120_09860, partial [Gemmataceae bacterium]|nr:hypothetical protein [Gemmataceae bacterium]
MSSQRLRSWLPRISALSRYPGKTNGRRGRPRTLNARLAVERCEDRTVPSTSIPLNAQTWTSIGPSPINLGQSPGNPSSTGRVNGIAVDSVNSNLMFAATDAGGLWRTTDGGKTWSPRTDQLQMQFQTIASVHRTPGDTVYVFDQTGKLYTSTDSATTFTVTQPFGSAEAGAVVNKLVVMPTDPNDQTKDILYAAVGDVTAQEPSAFPMKPPVKGSGIWLSTDGGKTWKNLIDSTKLPFTTNSATPIPADSLSFSDVATDPTNPNIVYAAVGNEHVDPTNGIYRTLNALSATPTWTLLTGGSQFVPGESPGVIKIAVAPNLPSEIFASFTVGALTGVDGPDPLLGIFRSLDTGSTWSPMLLTNPGAPVTSLANYLGTTGYDNDVLAISPTSPASPDKQIVYVAGFGAANFGFLNTVLGSPDGGNSWFLDGTDSNGVGPYPNVHQAAFDSQGRLVLATGGGIYRLTDTPTTFQWDSLNGMPGPNALNVVDFN